MSASVRLAHSIAKGAPDCANQVSSFRSIVAPRVRVRVRVRARVRVRVRARVRVRVGVVVDWG